MAKGRAIRPDRNTLGLFFSGVIRQGFDVSIRRMPRIYLEDLPNYELSGSISASLNRLKRWKRRGWRPVYVDLTRADLDSPVCRAIVSGLEVNAGF